MNSSEIIQPPVEEPGAPESAAASEEASFADILSQFEHEHEKATREALEGKWATGKAWWGVKEGAIDIVSINEKVPAEIKTKVETVKSGLKDGSFVIWKGPIVGQDGKEVLKKDEVADDKFLGGIKFYVKGVEGKVPGDK